MTKMDITFVLDRSGSMQAIAKDAEGGMNAYVEDRKNDIGDIFFTLIQFDSKYDIIYNGVRIEDVKPIKLEPRGSTALLDAVGRAINTTGTRLAATPEAQRPDKVIFVVLTDGEENASKEFSFDQIKNMVQEQTNVYSWEFVFLGANIDTFASAKNIGFTAANTANFQYSSNGIVRALNYVSARTTDRMTGDSEAFFEGNINI